VLFLCRQVLSVVKSKGVRVVFPYRNLHPQVCPPLIFRPLPVTVCVDGDDISDTASTPKNTDTTVTIVTFLSVQDEISPFAHRDYGCSHNKYHTH